MRRSKGVNVVEVRGQRSEIRGSRDAARRRHRLTLCSPCSDPRPLTSGLTLIELLITITILATLAALFLGASNAAMESARAARTKMTIQKIHTLLMERWESYATRRIDLNDPQQAIINGMPTSTPEETIEKSDRYKSARLNATRELVKLEIPDRWTDARLDELSRPVAAPIWIDRPSISGTYVRTMNAAMIRQNAITRVTNTHAEIYRNQSAECLYLVIMLTTGDGEARTLFSKQDIGDTDGDGLQEFLDGWGRPIQFVRWSTGFVSPLQPLDVNGNRDPDNDHDPFDPFRVDIDAYRYVPLVFSTGPDGQSGINTKADEYIAGVDPYFPGTGTDSTRPGTVLDVEQSIDNIHNHLQDGR